MINTYINIVGLILIFLFTFINSIDIIVNQDNDILMKLFAFIIIIFTIFIAQNRNIYLPFLGKTVIPPHLIGNEIYPVGANEELNLEVKYPDNTKIIYWGAKSTNKNVIKVSPEEAYGDYTNSGIAIVKNNLVKLMYFCPDKYAVKPFGINTKLNRHIHYRALVPNSSMLGEVKTAYINC
jgi:hypothetical protein